MSQEIYEEVAKEVNENGSRPTQGGVTVELVRQVAEGEDRCVSHPVINDIRRELRIRGITPKE